MFEGKKIPIYRPNYERVPLYSQTEVDAKGNPVPLFWVDLTTDNGERKILKKELKT